VGEETCERAYSWLNHRGPPNLNLLSKKYNAILTTGVREKDMMKQIKNDLHRTFPDLNYFMRDSAGAQSLENILTAVSCYDPQVGYVQGMNFIAAAI
jgi:hypothetical protein